MIIPELGLLSGLGGQILTCSEFFLHQKIPQNWLLQLHHILEEKLANDDFLSTHCSGLAGIGWLYEYLNQRKLIDYDTNVLLEDTVICPFVIEISDTYKFRISLGRIKLL